MNLLYRMKQAAIRLCGGYYEPKADQEGQDGALLLEVSKEYEAVHKILSGLCYNHDENVGLLSLAERVANINEVMLEAAQKRYYDLLASEHKLSKSYVRIREMVGAMNPPSLEQDALYAYVEKCVEERLKDVS